jgi:hypothetical protein
MKLGKLLSVGEVAEQPPVEEPPVAWPQLTRLDIVASAASDIAAPAASDDHVPAPAAASADR